MWHRDMGSADAAFFPLRNNGGYAFPADGPPVAVAGIILDVFTGFGKILRAGDRMRKPVGAGNGIGGIFPSAHP